MAFCGAGYTPDDWRDMKNLRSCDDLGQHCKLTTLRLPFQRAFGLGPPYGPLGNNNNEVIEVADLRDV